MALPMIAANAAVPLAGVVDTAVIGAVGDSGELGGIAMGAIVFNIIFSTTYFLRMGSSGLAAQAEGAADMVGLQQVLFRALGLAGVMGAVILAGWPLLSPLSFFLLGGSADVEAFGAAYFAARVWGAPGALVMFATTGWLIGRGRTRAVLGITGLSSLTNILLDVALVTGVGFGVEGIGAATAVADWVGALAGLWIAQRLIREDGGVHDAARDTQTLFDRAALRRLMTMNLDMMIRSWGLLIGFAWFINVSAQHGDAILAGNHVLLQIVTVWAFVLDAFAFTAETEVGRAIGQRSRPGLRRAIGVTSALAVGCGAVFCAITLIAGPTVLTWWIADAETAASARRFLPYCAVIPLLGAPAWQLDGIFIGATRSAAMRNASIASVAAYLLVDRMLTPMGPHGTWAAFLFYYVARAGALAVAYPRLERDAVMEPEPARRDG